MPDPITYLLIGRRDYIMYVELGLAGADSS